MHADASDTGVSQLPAPSVAGPGRAAHVAIYDRLRETYDTLIAEFDGHPICPQLERIVTRRAQELLRSAEHELGFYLVRVRVPERPPLHLIFDVEIFMGPAVPAPSR